MGYEADSKAYHMFDISSGRVIISPHVKFYKDKIGSKMMRSKTEDYRYSADLNERKPKFEVGILI